MPLLIQGSIQLSDPASEANDSETIRYLISGMLPDVACSFTASPTNLIPSMKYRPFSCLSLLFLSDRISFTTGFLLLVSLINFSPHTIIEGLSAPYPQNSTYILSSGIPHRFHQLCKTLFIIDCHIGKYFPVQVDA